MRILAKHSPKAYSSAYQNTSAFTDEHYSGSGWGDATIPPRPLKRLHSDEQPRIRLAAPHDPRAGYG